MADMEQTPSTGSAGSAAQTPAAGVGETQQANATASTGASVEGQSTNTQEVADDFEWNGSDVENLPKPLQNRARGMQKYFYKVTQEAAAVKHKAEAYEKLANDPRLKDFLAQGQQQAFPQRPIATPEAIPGDLTQDDVLQLQSGDPQAVQQVMYKLGQPLVKEIQQLKNELQLSKMEREIDAFAGANPDFWDVEPTLMKAAMQEAAKSGKGIAEAYQLAKDVEKRYFEKANSRIKQRVEEKKKAVSASPSQPLDPSVVEVADEQEAKRVAAEAAWNGKRVEVRVRGRKDKR